MASACFGQQNVTLIYKDFFNTPKDSGQANDKIYLDGTDPNLTSPFPAGTRFTVTATFDGTSPDTSHGDLSYYSLRAFLPSSATLTVYTSSGPQTYTFVQDYVSPYHNHPGQTPSELHRTEVAIFSPANNFDMPQHFGVGIISDPWYDGAGFLADFGCVDNTLNCGVSSTRASNFDLAALQPQVFSHYQGSGWEEGPGNPTLCGTGPNGTPPCQQGPGTSIWGRYTEPIKLRGSDGNYYWLNLTHGDTQSRPNVASVTLTSALRFHPLAPCRVIDTRSSGTPVGAGDPNNPDRTARLVDFYGSSCNVPTSALAYSVNVTAVPTGGLGYMTVYPKGETKPLVSTLNSIDGRIKSNAAIVAAGDLGKVYFYASNATHLVVDINGYFSPESDPSGLTFFPLTPCRVLDTRNANGPLGGPFLTGGVTRNIPVTASSCGLPSGAGAYMMNYTVVPKNGGPLGYLTTWPGTSTKPLVSTVNAPTGAITANAAIVPAGTDGSVNVFASNDTDLVIDVTGYFASSGANGQSLYLTEPCRVVDSRSNNGSAWQGTNSVSFTAGSCGAPPAAQTMVLNTTVVPPAGLGYLTLWPNGNPKPLASALNALDGAIMSNLSVIPAQNNSVNVFVSNPTHVVLDSYGYFAQ